MAKYLLAELKKRGDTAMPAKTEMIAPRRVVDISANRLRSKSIRLLVLY